MKPIEYIKQFRMDQENYQFSRPDFLKQLGKDLLESIENHPKKDPDTGLIPYKDFKAVVKQIQKKYWEISQLMPKENLTQGLWKCFFAMVVVKYRIAHYPDIQVHIEEITRKQKEAQDKYKS